MEGQVPDTDRSAEEWRDLEGTVADLQEAITRLDHAEWIEAWDRERCGADKRVVDLIGRIDDATTTLSEFVEQVADDLEDMERADED